MKGFRIEKFLLILIAIGICICFYTLLPTFNHTSQEIGLRIMLAVLAGVSLLAIYLIGDKRKYLRIELFNEFKYIIQESTVAWIIGLLLGSTICGIVLLSFGSIGYRDIQVNPSAFDIVGVYIGSVFGVLAVRAFYKNLHPIYDEVELIKQITYDLKKINDKSTSIWFSFPALNLCEFRIAARLVSDSESVYDAYKNELNSKINSQNVAFDAVCFNEDDIDLLYEKYGEINNSSKISNIKEAIDACKTGAKHFLTQVKTANSSGLNSRHHPMKPEQPVESFVIIGDIVYTIQAWGLPICKIKINNSQTSKVFVNPFAGHEPNSKLVRLIAYRQHDSELAKTIVRRTTTVVQL